MSVNIYLSEDKSKLTICDLTGKCLVYGKLDGQIILEHTAKFHRLSKEERDEVAKRYRDIPETGETASKIGLDYGISREAVRKIGMKTELIPILLRKQVIAMMSPEITSKDIADELGLPLATVNAIITRYRSIPTY